MWTGIEEAFKQVETGTSPDGVRKLTSDLKEFKNDLDTCLREFYERLELLGGIVDKYEVLKTEMSTVSEAVSGLEKRKSALNKTQPESVEDWQKHCQQLGVSSLHHCADRIFLSVTKRFQYIFILPERAAIHIN